VAVYVPTLKLLIAGDIVPLLQIIEYGGVPPVIDTVNCPSEATGEDGFTAIHSTSIGKIVTTLHSF
jgi:hypothetical protein